MSLADEMAYGLRMLIAEQRHSVVFRHKTKKNGANPAINPPQFDSLVVSGAVLAGVSSLRMAGDPFTGRFIIGDQFTIAGDLTVYTVSAEAVSATVVDYVDVPFTPVLAADAADKAVVTVTKYAADTAFDAIVTDKMTRLIDNTSVVVGDHQVRFLASSLPNGVEPGLGDQMFLQGGIDPSEIISSSHMETQGVHYGWSLVVRS